MFLRKRDVFPFAHVFATPAGPIPRRVLRFDFPWILRGTGSIANHTPLT